MTGSVSGSDGRLPLTLLTGFLGSGKTTVLRHLLAQPGLADTAVIVNELGEVGLDHLLVDHVAENLRLLQSGCVCCTVRGDLAETLVDLQVRRSAGEIGFSRVIVETTGLADPAPVLHTLAADAAVAASFHVDGVVTTVDAVNALSTLDRHEQALRQISMADVLLLTKTDLAADETVARIKARLARLNPAARAFRVLDGRVDPALVLDAGSDGLTGMREDPCEDDRAAAQYTGRRIARLHHHPHDESIRAHSFCIGPPVPGAAFAHWLELLAAMRGERLLRVKGLVCVAEHPDEPLLVHGAQHVMHPPRRLPRWPSADRRTRLVLITQHIERAELERTLAKFVGVPLARAVDTVS